MAETAGAGKVLLLGHYPQGLCSRDCAGKSKKRLDSKNLLSTQEYLV